MRTRNFDEISEAIRARDKEAHLQRLKTECKKTSKTFRKLSSKDSTPKMARYLSTNAHTAEAARIIHLLRAENSELRTDKFKRYLATDDK